MADKKTRKTINGLPSLIEWAKQHPSVMLAAAAGVGISGEQLKSLLSYEGPAWMLGVVVVLWALFNAGREHLNQQRKVADAVESLQEGFAEFRREVSAQMDSGVGKFQEHRTVLDDHSVRIGRLENIHTAELAAHVEKTRRETGKVGK